MGKERASNAIGAMTVPIFLRTPEDIPIKLKKDFGLSIHIKSRLTNLYQKSTTQLSNQSKDALIP
jgi:hypothetical protein